MNSILARFLEYFWIMAVWQQRRFLSFILLTGCSCVIFNQISYAESAAPQSPPKVAISNPIFDFGAVSQGTKVSNDFVISNSGSIPLIIQRVEPTCGCTAAVPEKNTLQPGEKTSVKVTFDTTGFEGYKVKSVRLYTNDPSEISSVLTLQGTVKTDIELKPENLYFGKIGKNEKKTLSATILLDENSPIKVLDVSSKSDYIKIETKDLVTGKQRGKQITVSLNDDVPVGILRSHIAIKTTSKNNPVVQIPVFARIEGDLKLSPSEVSFGLLEGPLQKTVSQTISITNEGEKPVGIVSLKSDNPQISTELKVIEAGKKYEIIVGVGEGAIGTLRAQIDVVTDHFQNDQSRFAIPIYGIISKKGA